MKITKTQLRKIISEEKLRMSIRNILTEAADYGVWKFDMDDFGNPVEPPAEFYPVYPTLKDYDGGKGVHKYGKLKIGDLVIEVKTEYVYEDPDGGRNYERYNIGYIIEADDSAPAGGGDSGSKRRYVGHDGKAYRLRGRYSGRSNADFQTFGSFDEAYKAANKYIEAYMQEKGLKPGQGQSDEMKAKLKAHARYFSR